MTEAYSAPYTIEQLQADIAQAAEFGADVAPLDLTYAVGRRRALGRTTVEVVIEPPMLKLEEIGIKRPEEGAAGPTRVTTVRTILAPVGNILMGSRLVWTAPANSPEAKMPQEVSTTSITPEERDAAGWRVSGALLDVAQQEASYPEQ
jgi:hypothetical protein